MTQDEAATVLKELAEATYTLCGNTKQKQALDIAIAVLDHQERIKTRLAQIASGDYKACGHTAEEVAKTALAELCGERQPKAWARAEEVVK